MYRNLPRRMIRGRFKRIGDNDGDFQYQLNNEKVHAICCTSDVSNFIRKREKDFAGHVIRMSIERCEEYLMFIPSLLEQALKFNNSTVDNFINNSLKR